MRKQKSCKPLLYLLLTGWCLLFLRCESTEKSMVRAVYLSQTGQGYQAGLLYQAPQAAADAAATMEYALGYLRVMLAGLIPFALTQAYASTLRESGQTTLPMRALSLIHI